MAGIDFGERGHEKWQKLLHVSDATEKRLATALFEITKIAQKMALPESTLKLSLKIYKKIISSNQTRRKPLRVLAATIVYIACRQDGFATSINQIGHLSKINPEKIRHVYNSISKKTKPISNHTTPEQYVTKLARSIFQQEKTIEAAKKIISTLKSQRFAQGKNPVGLGCSACYIASILTGEPKTQREIAELGRVTEATMRTRYHEISRKLIFKISL
jgi:transcription initiation factor TFIIB